MANPLELPSLVAGTAIGGAAAAAFAPAIERPRQDAWSAAPNRLPDVGLLAALVAGGKIELKSAQSMAARLGYDTGPFDSLVWLAQNRLDFPLMLRLWRLFPNYTAPSGDSIDSLVTRTLAHEQLDWNYHDLLTKLKDAERPGIGDIAYSVVRGYLPTNINLPVAPPSGSDYVPRFPQSKTLAEDLAAHIGFDKDMLQLMVARSGLSMAPVMAANALFRTDAKARIDALLPIDGHGTSWLQNTVGQQDYELAISEGDLRTEWAHAVRETARQILTAGEYAELELRGFIGPNERRALTSQHGMRDADSDMLYDVLGRAPAVHAITTGLARGATYPSDYSNIPEPYKSAIQRSNIRPEFAEIVYHDRYSYPSAFVLRSLAQAGDLGGQAEVEQVLLEIGWKPSFATQVSTAWTTKGPAADPHVAKAQGQLWTTTHALHKKGTITDAQATAALPYAGVSAAAIPEVLRIWDVENTLENGGTPPPA